jgi:hypothetical protein
MVNNSQKNWPPLWEILTEPARLVDLTPSQWDLILPITRRERILARLAFQIESLGLLDAVPAKAREHLASAKVIAADQERIIRWEVNRIQRALCDMDFPVVLLKGAAYTLAGLPPARGRLVSDVDIMVPRDRLPFVEAALVHSGWEPVKLHAYDQRYYRQWMHELPPLCHTMRQTEVDVHHNILPVTSRLRPDPARLLDAAIDLDRPGLQVLSPTDMVLHSATHLFYDGALEQGLRDLLDLHDLLSHFGAEPGFWERLVPRAQALDLQRPLFYALRYCKRLLDTPIPSGVTDEAQVGARPVPVLKIMDSLVQRALVPNHPDALPTGQGLVDWLLYVRSHYLRMPLYLLIPHLMYKAFRGRFPGEELV